MNNLYLGLFDRASIYNEALIGENNYLIHIKNSIRQNIENILNTINSKISPITNKYENSILDYGLRPLNYYTLDQSEEEYLCNAVIEKITIFEPRLNFVYVEMLDKHKNSILQMHVTGVIKHYKKNIEVSFLSSYQYVKDKFLLNELF